MPILSTLPLQPPGRFDATYSLQLNNLMSRQVFDERVKAFNAAIEPSVRDARTCSVRWVVPLLLIAAWLPVNILLPKAVLPDTCKDSGSSSPFSDFDNFRECGHKETVSHVIIAVVSMVTLVIAVIWATRAAARKHERLSLQMEESCRRVAAAHNRSDNPKGLNWMVRMVQEEYTYSASSDNGMSSTRTGTRMRLTVELEHVQPSNVPTMTTQSQPPFYPPYPTPTPNIRAVHPTTDDTAAAPTFHVVDVVQSPTPGTSSSALLGGDRDYGEGPSALPPPYSAAPAAPTKDGE
ncbi:uncharacterized protein EV422DRAFT_538950 [Fimicolochytrium jonesii]|uniref:uncharacterized protein n=1 Tax=Fimicolochytrium jonesii TaxID=1396493 RepID=UPI0022FE3F6A|nr:uncharacterized protein EV422DRAFT_538950 [Fimicolochytrium jonesii]KAI8818170.1 hypothetical protein EV422DRAFT_538950 [Fimicolochytrium jonesii]